MALRSSVPKPVLEEMARQLGIEDEDLTKAPVLQTIPHISPVYILNLQRNLAPYGGDIKSNYKEDACINNTNLMRSLTCPAGKRWYLFGGTILNGDNVGRSCYVQLHEAGGTNVLLSLLRQQTLTAGSAVFYPNTEAHVGQAGSGAYPLPIEAGQTIYFAWAAGGASAGGTCRSSAIVVEVDE